VSSELWNWNCLLVFITGFRFSLFFSIINKSSFECLLRMRISTFVEISVSWYKSIKSCINCTLQRSHSVWWRRQRVFFPCRFLHYRICKLNGRFYAWLSLRFYTRSSEPDENSADNRSCKTTREKCYYRRLSIIRIQVVVGTFQS